jgi:hypothetical protein
MNAEVVSRRSPPGWRRRLGAGHPDVARVGTQCLELVDLLVTARLAILARLGENGDSRATTATGEIDELLNECGRLRSAPDDHQRAARGAGGLSVRYAGEKRGERRRGVQSTNVHRFDRDG